MRLVSCSLTALLALLAFGCRPPQAVAPAPASVAPPSAAPATAPTLTWTTTPSGLGIQDLVVGKGATPALTQVCVVEVLAWIEQDGRKGTLFLDTRKRGWPATFPLGVKRVIQGWDEGVATMKVGGRRLLRVPPALGYTAREAGHDIPVDANLIFEVELVEVR